MFDQDKMLAGLRGRVVAQKGRWAELATRSGVNWQWIRGFAVICRRRRARPGGRTVIWLGWRQQRTETVLAATLLVLLGALLVPTGLQMAAAYHRDGLSACVAANPPAGCSEAIHSFTARFESIGNLMAWLTIVPGLIGVLLAAPFVLQLESGTYRLDWTQSITRGRWIAGKLALAIVAAVAASLVFVALVTWWRTPLVHVDGRMDPSVFDSEGIVAFGYALFALGLALAIGVVAGGRCPPSSSRSSGTSQRASSSTRGSASASHRRSRPRSTSAARASLRPFTTPMSSPSTRATGSVTTSFRRSGRVSALRPRGSNDASRSTAASTSTRSTSRRAASGRCSSSSSACSPVSQPC